MMTMDLADVPLSARNILEDPELKNAVKAFRYVLLCVVFSKAFTPLIIGASPGWLYSCKGKYLFH